MKQWRKKNDALGTVNRGDPCESGLCTLCKSDCKGKCETWLSSLMGRKLLYPAQFGHTTSGSSSVAAEDVGYHAVRIQGYAYGAEGLSEGLSSDPDDCIFPNVSIETSFGHETETKCRVPIMTGALGSTFIAEKYWDSFAVGAAICGFPIVIGENVVGVDKNSAFENGTIHSAPELERRIEIFRRYYDGYGGVIIQMNVEDSRNGVARYLAEKYCDDVIIELKWGQGAKNIGGEIQVDDLEYARFLNERGYVVDPDPFNPLSVASYENKSLTSFARHSRLGATGINTSGELRETFAKNVKELRELGFRRITLKTGAYGMEALALAIKCASENNLDLLTIDGAGGGTGMSPWNMMEQWGVPSLQLHAKTWEYCHMLDANGEAVPHLSLAGGFAREDHIFKAIALCSPYAKLVCMGRAPMIPGFLGSNIEGVFKPEKKAEIFGHWDELPSTVKENGTRPEEIFAGWEAVKEKVGSKEMNAIPFGAIALYGYVDKLSCGLQQFMAGARKFSIASVGREDLMAANLETAEVAGIPYLTDAQDDLAKNILLG